MTLEPEENKKWLRRIARRGWVVIENRGVDLWIRCAVQDCPHAMSVAPGEVPNECQWDHSGRFRQLALERYDDVSEILRARRIRLGLTQEETASAAGLADGHVSKLEADARVAALPTVILWAHALGLKINLVPDALPTSTASILSEKVGRPRQPTPPPLLRGQRRRGAGRRGCAPSVPADE